MRQVPGMVWAHVWATRRVCVAALSVCIVGATLVSGCGGEDNELETHIDGEEGPAPGAILAAALDDADPWVRAEAVRLVGTTRDTNRATTLRAALADPSPLVQGAAVEALLALPGNAGHEATLSTLASGSADQKVRLIDLIFANASESLRDEALNRAVRDTNPRVRRAAVDALTRAALPSPRESITRLLNDTDIGVADAAFAYMSALYPEDALREILARLRSSNADERALGMRFARFVDASELWPMMRSLVAQGTSDERAAALVVLGALGDPIAEDGLRTILLTAEGDEAAEALLSIARIPSERARQQPTRHQRDQRPEVRRAAFIAMQRLDYPLADFEPYLEDSEPGIGEQALLYIQRRDPDYAASVLARSLQLSTSPETVLRAVFRASRRHDLQPLLMASRAQLTQLSSSANSDVASLATRLLLSVEPPARHIDRILQRDQPAAVYALLESMLSQPRDPSLASVYQRYLSHDLLMVQVVAAVGMTQHAPR